MNKTLLAGVALAIAASLPAQWNQASPSPDVAGRVGAGMTYDPTTGTVLMFGGDLASGPFGGPISNELWRFDGSGWQLLAPAVTPPGSVGVELAYDSNRGVFVTYGSLATGFFGGPSADRTWEFDGVNWTEIFPVHTPGGLGLYGMTFDSVRNKVVLHGGLPDNFFPIDSGLTWEYDGNDWTQMTPATSPGPLERPAMCFHAGLGVTVLFGGIDVQIGGTDKTWLWNGTDWSEAAIVGTRPSPRTGCKMVYDSARQVCVMSGGSDPFTGTPANDTWELDLAGLTWTQVNSTFTDPRRDFAMAYDVGRKLVVMIGGIGNGFTALSGTWEYGAKNTTFGTGCAGSNGVPALSAVDAPRFGQAYTLNFSGLNTTLNLGVMVLSNTEIVGGLALDFLGMTGCTGYVTPDILFTVSGAAGAGSWTATMPNNTALLGADLFAQVLSLDTVNPAFLVASNAQHGVLGN